MSYANSQVLESVQVKAQATKRALPASIDEIERVVSNLEATLRTLYSQLHPVLDAPQSLKEGVIGEDAPQQQHYASRLQDMVYMLNGMNETAHDIIARLHV